MKSLGFGLGICSISTYRGSTVYLQEWQGSFENFRLECPRGDRLIPLLLSRIIIPIVRGSGAQERPAEIIDGGPPYYRRTRGAVNNTFYRPRSGFRTERNPPLRFPSPVGDLSVKILPKQKKRTRRGSGLLTAREWQFPRCAPGTRGIRSPVRSPVLALKGIPRSADYVAECRAGKMFWVIFAGPYIVGFILLSDSQLEIISWFD